jgi:NAD(P)-dependent dehydrogenase (short-subunit alcohol dehydrogenase family)
MRHLEGKVAIITGGGRGIGRAVARAYSKAGASVVIAARSSKELDVTVAAIDADRGKALAVVADTAEEATGPRLLQTALENFGHCDILVNAAAINGPLGEVELLDPRAWDATIRINLTGIFLACRALVPHMKARRTGRIINVASGLAVRVQPGYAAYSVSKAAVLHFSRLLAEEVREYGIYVNAVHPGIVKTAIIDELLSLGGESAVLQKIAARSQSILASGEMKQPEEITGLFLWLGAESDITGQFIQHDDISLQTRFAELAASNG